jgi:endo-1,4-beta-xylanase
MRHTIFNSAAVLIAVLSISTAEAQETLRQYADKIGLSIGTCTGGGMYRRGDANYVNTLKREFNTIVAENEMKASALQPTRGGFNFSTADDMVKFAEENNMKLRGHCLIWHAQNPSWLQSGTWTRETLLEAMKEHIQGVLKHFRAKNKIVFEWDVVNEAFSDGTSGGMRNSFWKKNIGEDFLDSAFTYAHEADPDVLLFYNDYNTSNVTAKSTAVYNKIKKMVENGVPISGVGFQSHQTLEEYTPAFIVSLKENFDRFAALGLKLSITELDIRITMPSDADELAKQADYYKEYMQTVLATPACRTFMIWGFTDSHSWVPGTFPGTGDALIFDKSYKPKPAYTSLLDVLKTYKPAAVLPAGRTGCSGSVAVDNTRGSGALFNLLGMRIGSSPATAPAAFTIYPSGAMANQAVVSNNGRTVLIRMR